MRSSTLSLALLLSTLTTACSRAPGPIKAEDFPLQYAEAICQQAASCQNQSPYLEAQCRDRRLQLLGGDDVARAIAAGRIDYDEAQAHACIEGILATGCTASDFSDQTVADCLGALRGKAAPGARCDGFFECAAGFCGGADSAGQCPATCPQTLGEGATCSLHFGPDCDLRAGLRCVAGQCVKPAGAGQPCVDNSGCQSGLICILPNGSQQPICARLHKQNEPCSDDDTCQAGLYCLKGGDDAAGTCVPRLAEGQPCAQDGDSFNAAIRGVQCQDGLICIGAGLTWQGDILPGICRPPRALGGGCPADRADMQLQLDGCQTGLICPAGLCTVPPSEGMCNLHDGCQPGVAWCDPKTLTCAPLKDNGAPCAIPPECKSGFCGPNGCADEVVYCHEP